MADSLATAEDVRGLWTATAKLPSDDTIASWLAACEVWLFSLFPDLQAAVATDEARRKALVFVECSVVMRVFQNPDGIRQRAQTMGPMSDSVTYGAETLQGSFMLTAMEKAMLAGPSQVFQVDLLGDSLGAGKPAWLDWDGDNLGWY